MHSTSRPAARPLKAPATQRFPSNLSPIHRHRPLHSHVLHMCPSVHLSVLILALAPPRLLRVRAEAGVLPTAIAGRGCCCCCWRRLRTVGPHDVRNDGWAAAAPEEAEQQAEDTTQEDEARDRRDDGDGRVRVGIVSLRELVQAVPRRRGGRGGMRDGRHGRAAV